MVSKLCESIVCASDKENWTESLVSCVNDFSQIEKLLDAIQEDDDVQDVYTNVEII